MCDLMGIEISDLEIKGKNQGMSGEEAVKRLM